MNEEQKRVHKEIHDAFNEIERSRKHSLENKCIQICNRLISGAYCRCRAEYADINNTQYWHLLFFISELRVDTIQDEDRKLIDKMKDLAIRKAQRITENGKKVIILPS